MNSCHDSQNKFKFVDGSVNISTKTKAENFEKYFQVVKYCKADLQFSLMFEKIFSWFLIRSVFETNTCCHKSITQGDYYDQDMVNRTLKESVMKILFHTHIMFNKERRKF